MALGDKQKLNKFADAVLADARERAEAIRKDTREKEFAMLEEGRAKIALELKGKAEEKLNAVRAENSRALAELDRELRRRMLFEREAAADEILHLVRGKLAEFALSGEYREFLCRKCVDILSSQDCDFTVYLAPKDMSFSLDILKALSQKPEAAARLVGVESDDNIVLGGVRFIGNSKNIAIDLSLDRALEDRREYLSTIISRAISN